MTANTLGRAATKRTRVVQGLLVVATLLVVFALTRHHEVSALPMYEPAVIDAQLDAGEPLVVLVHAVWCPTCAKMDKTLATLRDKPAFSGVGFYHIDFDEQKSLVRQYGVIQQSTLIVFQDGEEVAREIALTDPTKLERFVETALAK